MRTREESESPSERNRVGGCVSPNTKHRASSYCSQTHAGCLPASAGLPLLPPRLRCECSGRQEARAGLGRASSGPSRERSLSEPRKNTMPGNTAWGCTCPISKPSHLRIDSSHRFLTRALSCTAGDRPSPSRPPAGPFRVPVWPVEGPLAFPGSWVSSESSRRGVCWA